MYFPDLEKCEYHSGPLDAACWQAPLLAVGWLEHPHRFSCGTPPEGLLEKLGMLASAAEESHPHYNFRGLHCCSICEAERGASKALLKSHVNILIPGNGVVYATPAGITHYIEVHSYIPPIEFITAVKQCPAYGSAGYYESLCNSNHGTAPPMITWEEHVHTTREMLSKVIEARDAKGGYDEN